MTEENIDKASTEPIPQTIGQFLKQQREKKGLSIKVISHNTKITTTLLDILENDRLDELPNKAYVSGYIKSYVKVLGLAQEPALELLEKTYSRLHPKVSRIQKQDGDNQQAGSSAKIALISAAIVFIAIFIYIMQSHTNVQTTKSSNNPETITPHVLTAETPLEQKSEQNSKNGTIEKAAEVDEKNNESKQEIVIATPAKQDKLVKIETPTIRSEEKIKDKSKDSQAIKKEDNQKRKDKTQEISFHPFSTKLFSVAKDVEVPQQVKGFNVAGKQNIYIIAKEGDTWLTYKKDEEIIKKIILKHGKSLLVRGDEIRLFIGNINAAQIFYNGNPIDVMSRSGVKSLVFPEESKSKYVLPLFIFNNDGTVITSDDYLKAQAGN